MKRSYDSDDYDEDEFQHPLKRANAFTGYRNFQNDEVENDEVGEVEVEVENDEVEEVEVEVDEDREEQEDEDREEQEVENEEQENILIGKENEDDDHECGIALKAENYFRFDPNDLEKEVVKYTLGQLYNTNRYSWSDPNWFFNEKEVGMIRVGNSSVLIGNASYDIDIQLNYYKDECVCDIKFCERGSESVQNLTLHWLNDSDSNNLIITKEVVERHYLVFSRTVNYFFIAYFENDYETYPWCYHVPVKTHLRTI